MAALKVNVGVDLNFEVELLINNYIVRDIINIPQIGIINGEEGYEMGKYRNTSEIIMK